MDLNNLSKDLKWKTGYDGETQNVLNNINSVTGIVDNSTSSLQALIFSNKEPQFDEVDPTNYDLTGINSDLDSNTGFIFDLKKDYKFNLQSDITDHYVEDNVAIQDHVALKPITLEVSGVIAEVDMRTKNFQTLTENKSRNKVNIKNKGNLYNQFTSYSSRMGSLSQFAPHIVGQALNIANSAFYAYGTAKKFVNMVKKDKTQEKKEAGKLETDDSIIKTTKQFEYVTWFKEQWRQRASFTIITPYGVLTNMYIIDFSATQPESSRFITNLNIRFKEIRKAEIIKIKKKSAETKEIQDNKQEIVTTQQEKTPMEWLGHSMTETNLGTYVGNDMGTVIQSNSTATYNAGKETKLTEQNKNRLAESLEI